MNPLVYLKEKPWENLSHQFSKNLINSEEIVREAKLDYTVNSESMYSELHGEIPGYYTVFREDTSKLLGVVKTNSLDHIQNTQTFLPLEKYLTDGGLKLETVGALSDSKIFGVFETVEEYNILGDSFKHYFIVINDHLKPDGKVTVYNTPFRVVCMNQVESCLQNNFYAARIPVFEDTYRNIEVGSKIIESGIAAMDNLCKRANKLVDIKISREKIEDILDELFPITLSHDEFGNIKSNQAVEMARETFVAECLSSDNLTDFRGTAWGLYNACVDFDTHYYKNVDNMYDLSYRMGKIFKIGTEKPMAAKFLALVSSLAA